MDGAPGIQLEGVGFADFLQRGGADSAGNFLQTGEPLLLQAPDKGLVVPAQVGNHDDVAAGDIAAHVAVALHEDDVLGTGTGRRNGCGMAGSAAAHNQNITFVIYGNFTALF